MAKKIHVMFVLDETGSMMSVKGQTISGFNEYVGALRDGKGGKNVRFSLVRFNSCRISDSLVGVKLDDVPELIESGYQPDCTTPLYDAIGRGIQALEKVVDGTKDAALMVIQTDGQENASKEYTRQGIFDLIAEKKKAGWTFAFLGADQDAYAASAQFGIPAGNTVSYASANTRQTFGAAAAASVNYARSGGAQTAHLFDDDKAKKK